MPGAIAGPDPQDPTALQAPVPDYPADIEGGVAGLRAGIDRAWIGSVSDAEILRVLADAEAVLRGLGARIVEICFPDMRPPKLPHGTRTGTALCDILVVQPPRRRADHRLARGRTGGDLPGGRNARRLREN
jgi:amidase